MNVGTVILILVLLAILAYFGVRQLVNWILRKEIFQVKPNERQTPADVGLPYESLIIQSGLARLQAWFVEAPPNPDKPRVAMLLLHGTGESISDWIGVQKYLHDHGISSMVFDYSGYGDSTGQPSFAQIRHDVIAACTVFSARIGNNMVPYLFGFSLGAEALLDVFDQLELSFRAVIIAGALASARALVLDRRMLPPWLIFLIPDVFNNVRAITRVKQPLLIIHSQNDEVIPFSHAGKLLEQCNRELTQLIELSDLKHNDIWQQPSDLYWSPIIQFIQAQLQSTAIEGERAKP
jgi:uncharacterized protein